MFDAPIDEWYRWIGVAVASVAVLAVATGLPTETAPDAAAAARTVDSVASSSHPAVGEQPIGADRIRLGPGTVSLRDGGTTTSASFAYGPVTPVRDGSPLAAVLAGDPPDRAFDSPAAFERAAAAARDRQPAWRPAGERLLVRHVSWEGVDVTLVGA